MLVVTDSNSYLRVARELHPLLGRDFGSIPYLLNIHRDFEEEYSKNSRLQNKFHWVNEAIYLNNRASNIIQTNGKNVGTRIVESIPFFKYFKNSKKLTISSIDIFILATAMVLNIPVLTDDPDMLISADEFEIEVIKCIPFLAYLKSHSIADDNLLITIFGYWESISDCPKGYHLDLETYLPTVNILLKQADQSSLSTE